MDVTIEVDASEATVQGSVEVRPRVERAIMARGQEIGTAVVSKRALIVRLDAAPGADVAALAGAQERVTIWWGTHEEVFEPGDVTVQRGVPWCVIVNEG